ncbi:MAG: exosortase/archaeosortase family protein [Fimbriimonadales bacterium]
MKEDPLMEPAPVVEPTDTRPPLDPDEIEIPFVGMRLERRIMPWLVAALGALLLLGWFFLSRLPSVWFDEEGYYSHGLLIPFMAIAVIYARRDKIRAEPVGSSSIGLILMILGLASLLASKVIDNLSLAAFSFILATVGGVLFAFGRKISKHIVGPVLFLVFMMPVLGWAIDSWTNPLQLASTKVADKMLNVAGYETDMSPAQPTVIHMNNYPLNVGGPCSGFKLILSLVAFTSFFAMISGLGWKKNALLFAITLPLALFVNGLRIMLIGAVGESQTTQTPILSSFASWLRNYGDDAGMVFHDYSGYITLLVCFVILHFIVRALEGRRQPDAVAS